MSEIISVVAEAVYSFTARTGKEPTNLYLGSKDIKDVLRASNLCPSNFSQCGGRHLTIMGLKAFIVDRDRHVAVS